MAVNLKRSVSNPVARDIGNLEIQGRVVSKTINLPMFTNNRNAVWGAVEQLRKDSYPFATISFTANRHVFKLEVANCFKFSYAPYNLTDLICRVVRIEEDNLSSENIIVHAVEDVFSVANAITSYSAHGQHTVPRPDYAVAPFTNQLVDEAPYVLTDEIEIIPLSCRASKLDLGFSVYMSIDGGNSYSFLEAVENLKPYGTLVGTYPASTFTIDDTVGCIIDFEEDASLVETITWAEALAGEGNTALLGDELISFQTITPVAGSQYELTHVIRGRFGTVKQDHAEGTPFYFIGNRLTTVKAPSILAGADLKFKFVPYNIQRAGDIADAVALDLSVAGKALSPYRPVNFVANGSNYAARYTGDIVLEWSPRHRGEGAGIGTPGVALSSSTREGLFKIEVWVSESKVREVTDLDAVTWTYTEAMNLSDNGTLADSVTFLLSNFRVDGGVTYTSEQASVVCKKT